MISETRERFLQAILERIPAERIVELHLFAAIRQGPMETGVAVIAAISETPEATRTEVLTASYAWTRKGPERGKWVVDIVTQADAPLSTVETVVRGVQVRAGEALDAHRITGAELQSLLATDPSFAGARPAAR